MTGPLQRLRAFDRRQPLWWDVALAIVLTAVSIKATGRLALPGVALLTIVGGAIVVRRREPFRALLTAVAGVVVVAAASAVTDIGLPWTYLAVWVLLFNVGLRRGGRQFAVVGVLVVLTAVAAMVAVDDGPAAELGERARSSLTVTAMCVASFLAGVQIHHQRRALARQQKEAARAAVIAERSRIAQEMHDIIGHNLSVITSLANGGAVAVRSSPSDAQRAFEAIGEVSRSSVREVQRVLAVLRWDRSSDGASLSPQPTLDDVAGLLESVRAAGVHAELERTGDLRGLSAGRQLVVYRIVQESLTNVLRHAGAQARVSVLIARDDDGLVVAVDDSGLPPTTEHRPDQAGSGHGIAGMRERVEAYGGTLEAHALGTGWRVRARIPVGRQHEQ